MQENQSNLHEERETPSKNTVKLKTGQVRLSNGQFKAKPKSENVTIV
jgi:hypothetical protein